jgi:glycosyltransferase involved in cell wall biosynthesis
MKICFVCEGYHQYRGGIESFTHCLSHALIQKGHEVHIITTSGNERFYLEDLSVAGLYIHKVELKKQPFLGFWRLNKILPLFEIYFSCLILSKIKEVIGQFDIDIVESSILNFWNFSRRVPFVIRLHGYAGFENRYKARDFFSLIRSKLKWCIESMVLKKADKIISVSADHLKAVGDIWGFDIGEKACVVHNGVDIPRVMPLNDIGFRQANVVFVGRIKEDKGVETIINGASSVLKEFPGIKFYFIGKDSEMKGKGESYIGYLINKLRDERVIFLGALPHEDVMRFYRDNLIAVFPSNFREPFPLVVLEAMAYGCVVIASRIGGIPEVVEEDVSGVLVAPNDSEALAETIKELLKNETLRNFLSKNASEKIRDHFSIEKTAEKSIVVYKFILDIRNLAKGKVSL